MNLKNITALIQNWGSEFQEVLQNDSLLYLALFTQKAELLYANSLMSSLLNGNIADRFINPSFEQLKNKKADKPLLFEGYLTIGDYQSINTSIFAKIYRKDNEYLLIGGIEAPQLIEQNKQMHQLNREINNLQRQLIKEKINLEKTLQKLNKSNSELEKLNADKDQFMSILAHDLKSPFNSLLGFSSLLAEDLHEFDMESIERQVQFINKISHQTYYLLEDLLLWSQSQSGKMPFSPSRLSTYEICNEVVESLIHIAQKKNISIDFSSLRDIHAFADYNMLKTILRNLISNAIKFTPEDGLVRITAQSNSIEVIFSITDNGVGIADENISKILNSYERFSTNGTRNEHGTGLGMNLCLDFIHRHKGEIKIVSKQPMGSTFSFNLPNPDSPQK
jgi:signal transduction histidine kinase